MKKIVYPITTVLHTPNSQKKIGILGNSTLPASTMYFQPPCTQATVQCTCNVIGSQTLKTPINSNAMTITTLCINSSRPRMSHCNNYHDLSLTLGTYYLSSSSVTRPYNKMARMVPQFQFPQQQETQGTVLGVCSTTQ